MPWSDLNVVVSFRSKQLIEEAQAVKSVQRFQDLLLKDKSLVEESSFELKSNIVIMKVYLSKKFNSKLVEIIFKLFVNPAMPKNEEIMADYIKSYPISRSIYLVFRTILHNAGLDDPSDGGINSLALFLMIVGFIQKIESMAFSNSKEPVHVHIHSHSMSEIPQGSDPSQFSIRSHSSRTNEKAVDRSVAGSVYAKYLGHDHIGEIFMNMIYFYGFSFDYLNNYIHPYVSKESRCNSFLQVG
jgi:DNA polymerase sigma